MNFSLRRQDLYLSHVQIEQLLPKHWLAVAKIYEQGIASGNATFQTHALQWEKWNQSDAALVRLVAVEVEKIIVWAAASSVVNRPVYAGVDEVSIYVDSAFQGKGVGKYC